MHALKLISVVLVLFITLPSKGMMIVGENGNISVSINGKSLNILTDSLSINATGQLMINSEDSNVEQSQVRFKVVIRHRTIQSNFPILVYEERFQDGKEFLEVPIEKILTKAKPGDQILIITIDPLTKSGKETMVVNVINVSGDKC